MMKSHSTEVVFPAHEGTVEQDLPSTHMLHSECPSTESERLSLIEENSFSTSYFNTTDPQERHSITNVQFPKCHNVIFRFPKSIHDCYKQTLALLL